MDKIKEISGRVTEGLKRGTELGFPTINIEGDFDLPFGVYAVMVIYKGKKMIGAMHYGLNHTFNSGRPVLEVHILDFDSNLYNETVKIEVYNKIRDSKRFDSVWELKNQIEKDIQQIKQLCLNM